MRDDIRNNDGQYQLIAHFSIQLTITVYLLISQIKGGFYL